MFGYEVFKLDEIEYVRHVDSGEIIPFNAGKGLESFAKRYQTFLWKLETGIFDSWFNFGKTMRKQIKKETMFRDVNTIQTMTTTLPSLMTRAIPSTVCSFGTKAMINVYDDCVPCNQEKEKDTTMYLDCTGDLAIQQKQYFLTRISDAFWDKDHDLSKAFGLVDDKRPETVGEILERIAAGKFIATDDAKKRWAGEFQYYVRWRDPAVKEDHDGYAAALETMKAAKTEAKDAIMVGDAAAAKAAVDAFVAKTFH